MRCSYRCDMRCNRKKKDPENTWFSLYLDSSVWWREQFVEAATMSAGEYVSFSAVYNWVRYSLKVRWDDEWNTHLDYGYWDGGDESVLAEFRNIIWLENDVVGDFDAFSSLPIASVWWREVYHWWIMLPSGEKSSVDESYAYDLFSEMLESPEKDFKERLYLAWFVNRDFDAPDEKVDFFDYYIWPRYEEWETESMEKMLYKRWTDMYWYIDESYNIFSKEEVAVFLNSHTNLFLPRKIYNKLVSLPYAPIEENWVSIRTTAVTWNPWDEIDVIVYFSPKIPGNWWYNDVTDLTMNWVSSNSSVAYAEQYIKSFGFSAAKVHLVGDGTATLTWTTSDWLYSITIEANVATPFAPNNSILVNTQPTRTKSASTNYVAKVFAENNESNNYVQLERRWKWNPTVSYHWTANEEHSQALFSSSAAQIITSDIDDIKDAWLLDDWVVKFNDETRTAIESFYDNPVTTQSLDAIVSNIEQNSPVRFVSPKFNAELSETEWIVWGQITVYAMLPNMWWLYNDVPDLLEIAQIDHEDGDWYNTIITYNVTGEGTTMASFSTADWFSDSIEIICSADCRVRITSIDESEIDLNEGDSFSLTYQIDAPCPQSLDYVDWNINIDDEYVATVSLASEEQAVHIEAVSAWETILTLTDWFNTYHIPIVVSAKVVDNTYVDVVSYKNILEKMRIFFNYWVESYIVLNVVDNLFGSVEGYWEYEWNMYLENIFQRLFDRFREGYEESKPDVFWFDLVPEFSDALKEALGWDTYRLDEYMNNYHYWRDYLTPREEVINEIVCRAAGPDAAFYFFNTPQGAFTLEIMGEYVLCDVDRYEYKAWAHELASAISALSAQEATTLFSVSLEDEYFQFRFTPTSLFEDMINVLETWMGGTELTDSLRSYAAKGERIIEEAKAEPSKEEEKKYIEWAISTPEGDGAMVMNTTWVESRISLNILDPYTPSTEWDIVLTPEPLNGYSWQIQQCRLQQSWWGDFQFAIAFYWGRGSNRGNIGNWVETVKIWITHAATWTYLWTCHVFKWYIPWE